MLHAEHSAILSIFIMLSVAIKTLVLSNFEWPHRIGFTVFLKFSVSGCTDYYAETEQEGFQMGRDAVAGFNLPDPLGPQLEPCDPIYDPGDLEGLIPARDQHLLDIHQVFFSARYNAQTLSGDKNSTRPLVIKNGI